MVESFEFALPPAAGDFAPNVELQSLGNGTATHLSSLRGKVVCLEFWATWCGPCQPSMAKLNDLCLEQSANWKDRVILVPVSIDDTPERVRSHVMRKGWDRLQHYWAAGDKDKGFDAPAARAFVVSGVPEAVLLGVDGRIVWRGHPSDKRGGQDLRARIEAELKK
jgi:thiol-disulfide isomerase/thioredoxin